MIMMEANYLDDETILRKLPNISPDEVANILARKDAESQSRFVREDEEDNNLFGGEAEEEGEEE